MMKLEVGQVLKNYNALCELLGVKPTKGKGRGYHFEDFSRYCKWHKEGQKIIIDEVYKTPLEKVDKRSANTFAEGTRYTQESVYKIPLQKLVISYLTENEDFLGSVHSILKLEELINTNISNEQYTESSIEGKYISIFDKRMNGAFENALKGLEKLGIIRYRKCFMFRFKGDDWSNEFDFELDMPKEAQELYKTACRKAEEKGFNNGTRDNRKSFKQFVVDYMNKNSDYEKDIISYRRAFHIERGANFIVPYKMPNQEKNDFQNVIHEKILLSKEITERKASIIVNEKTVKNPWGSKDRDAIKEKIFNKAINEVKEELFCKVELQKVKDIQITRIIKEIKFHAVHSDKHIALQKITALNEEYYTLTKRDCVEADKFFAELAEAEYLRALERVEEVEESTTFIIPSKVLEAKEDAELSYMIQHAMYECEDYYNYY